MLILFLAFCASLIGNATPIAIDNGLTQGPEIDCNPSSISVNFGTRNPFEGHVYAKGFYDDVSCKTDATNRNVAFIDILFSSGCGIRRQRSLNPPGISISVVIVVTFHPRFLTKVDSAFNIVCFYMEAEKTVQSQISVSMISTTATVTETVQMPVCHYEVLRESITGQAVRYARIGEPVFHKWTCDATDQSANLFCMTVHTCTVDDGQGAAVQLLDANGCAQDRYLLNNLDYLSDLMAGVEAHVFKYADKPTLFFTCQIRLTLKSGPTCQRTSDGCPTPTRGKRFVDEYNSPINDSLIADDWRADMDVNSGSVTVLDDLLSSSGSADSFPVLPERTNHPDMSDDSRNLCMSPIIFTSVTSVCVTLFCLSVLGCVLLTCKFRRRKARIGQLETASVESF